ncbi:3'(2'),5'-bisphosphate nucleotidase CysQ [Cyclobacterium qasimii]|uniref:3'(2'),5'-bisphosphate nucleotidase CysQ n=2 Tax=Cyclobacterium qasimii TaxID=1350429 RepID=S7VAG8_9BACT|nr:3'(2'),5'-bisphosphate nucleotidase CysQ [Cyclobacterium qasimii]EPR66562.1 3'(2'),5'-bisphosphate nucleotidase [Cyclobacterium qasimii M12-11B]GEO20594.1 3'(2'),5'-bisphosphate nucleotidase CysQ [Cyclobacterium qasimii]
MKIDEKHLTEIALVAAKAAGQEILKIYESADLGLEYKADESPLTKADLAAHQKISEYLLTTQLPILSEEGKCIPYSERKDWEFFWMVDPLDGTKEFVKKNGEFTVNIALIHKGVPVMGVVYAPVLDWMYWGNSQGAWKANGSGAPLKLLEKGNKSVETIVASRSHLSIETQEVIDKYPGAEVISMGSSLKFMLLADNKAQLYPRFAPTMEWDTAAAHAILRALGYDIKKVTANEPLDYNKENLLNPWFIAS